MADTHTNIVPEILIYDVLQGILTYLRADIKAKPTLEDTILYSILQDINLVKYNYIKEAGELFSRDSEHPKHVDVRLFFDAKRATLPTMHITLANESPGPINSIGISEDEIVYENDYPDDETSTIYGRSFDTSLTIICTSSSHQEVLLMYYVMRASIIAAFNSFELQGFQNMKISGRDLQIRDDLVPNAIFSRGITISGFYETRVRDFFNTEKLYDIIFGERKAYIP